MKIGVSKKTTKHVIQDSNIQHIKEPNTHIEMFVTKEENDSSILNVIFTEIIIIRDNKSVLFEPRTGILGNTENEYCVH